MAEEFDYIPRKRVFVQEDNSRRYYPRHKAPPVPEGQDFTTLTEKHGRPRGPFEHDRQLQYRGG